MLSNKGRQKLMYLPTLPKVSRLVITLCLTREGI